MEQCSPAKDAGRPATVGKTANKGVKTSVLKKIRGAPSALRLKRPRGAAYSSQAVRHYKKKTSVKRKEKLTGIGSLKKKKGRWGHSICPRKKKKQQEEKGAKKKPLAS